MDRDARARRDEAYVRERVLPAIFVRFGAGLMDAVVGGGAEVTLRLTGSGDALTLSELPLDENAFNPRRQHYYWIPLVYKAITDDPVHGDVAYTVALLGRDFYTATNERGLDLIMGDPAVTITTFLAERAQQDPGIVYLRIRRRRAGSR